MIDLHCHLDLFPDPKSIILESARRGVYVMAVTTTPLAWNGLNGLLKGCDRIRPALGLHPELAAERERELSTFGRLLSETRYVGEIGLDGSPKHRPSFPAQLRVFRSILKSCAQSGGKILSIHSRGAATAVLDELRDVPGAGVPVLHWFSGSKAELNRAISAGAWFSVGTSMVLSQKGRELVASMPRDRILTETDGPFGKTNNKPSAPWDVAVAAQSLFDLWGVSSDSGKKILIANFKFLLSAKEICGSRF
ncbi:MAG: Qat anti-phage system TatD family nuclease QatD [Verrucomicrobiota bacterium]